MADSGSSRGRARGRARSVNPQGQGQSGDPRVGSSRGPAPGHHQPRGWGGPRPGGGGPRPQPQQDLPVWGPRPTGPTPQQAYQQRTPAPMAAPVQAGRATIRKGDSRVVEEQENVVVGPGGDGGNNSAGRGSVRGRRTIAYDTQTLLTRPSNVASKKGVTGTPIRLSANYFELIGRTDWCLYQYRVDFAPAQDLTSVKKKLLSQAVKDKISGYMFDGTLLFTSRRIQPDPMEIFVSPLVDTEEPIRITIRLVGNVAQGDYHMIQFFNIIVRKCLSYMKLQLVGRNYYDAAAQITIAEYGIELWPGYVTSIRQHESKILLCCEISHKFMRNENVLKILTDFAHRDRHDYKRSFEKHIIGCVILTGYNNRTYCIDDIDWDVTPKSTFLKKDGNSISYIEYYKQRYKLNITEVDQPMLISRAKPREIRAGMAEMIYLVPELCRMTGLTEQERGNMNMMRELAKHTRLNPEGRQDRLEKFSLRMNKTPRIVEELQKWDMRLSPKLIEFPGRVLPPETIVQGPGGRIKYPAGQDTDWTRNLRSNAMFTLGQVHIWVVVCPVFLKRDAYTFVQALQKAASGMSFQLPHPKLQEIPDDKPATYLEGLDAALNHNPNLILCVASNNKADRYQAIKKKCCVDKAVPTQVILKKNMMKGVMSVATKVAIQINCKLGGAPWTVDLPLTNLMVVGFDVCHDTMQKNKSYGAMVASLDRQCTRYFSAAAAHVNGEELSNDFSLNIIKATKKYQENNKGQLPEKIIIYRDGVGDGQLPYVHSHEVKRIREQLQIYYKEKPLKMAFIIVTKRINTRLFASNSNPPPGTVVDDVVTLPQRYDFFIVSQCVRQGTVSPTSYNVIDDTLGLDPDRMQRLTYKFTHMYYNWSGTVRVPAPCQYAHKLAFLVSQSLHRNPNPQLDNTLYFL